jgi:hypothetical protein
MVVKLMGQKLKLRAADEFSGDGEAIPLAELLVGQNDKNSQLVVEHGL